MKVSHAGPGRDGPPGRPNSQSHGAPGGRALPRRLVTLAASRFTLAVLAFMMTTLAVPASLLIADEPVSVASAPSADTHYGLFNWLDERSMYGQGAFPEPFLIDDSDLEVNEARLDWEHTESRNQKDNVITAEIEKGFGLLTLELEVPLEIDTTVHPRRTTRDFDNIDLGARYPLRQFISDRKFVDSTFGVALEVGIPTRSAISKDAEVVPKVFNDLRIGDHFTLQSIIGDSMLYGSDKENDLNKFEYGFVFGYSIQHKELPVPGVLQVIPVFELSGETELNKDNPGHTSLTGNAAVRFNAKTIGQVQPRLGIGYVFPINDVARNDMHWGVFTSLVFEY